MIWWLAFAFWGSVDDVTDLGAGRRPSCFAQVCQRKVERAGRA